jgi:hypothetical protein
MSNFSWNDIVRMYNEEVYMQIFVSSFFFTFLNKIKMYVK